MQRLKDINWNHLYGFFEVAREQSIKNAAKKLNLSPSTLSEQLKKLEGSFGKKLFHRSTKGLSLTSEGSLLFEHASIIFEEGSRVLEKFSTDDIGGYPVTIGIVETLTSEIASEFCSQYWDLYAPFGTVNTLKQVEHDVLVDNLLHNNIDWGIAIRRPKRKNLDFAEIGTFEVSFCCSSKLFRKFKNKSDLMINIPFAESTWDTSLNKQIYQHLRSDGIIPKEKFYSDHMDYLVNLCKRSRCIMPMVKNPLKKYPGIKFFEIKKPIVITLYAVWRKEDEELISIKKLKDLIHSRLADVPGTYDDSEMQIELSSVSDDLLND
jgi:DNA-binding transcriptional LysR family regulator